MNSSIYLEVIGLFSLPAFDLTLVHGICLENNPFHTDFSFLLSRGFVVGSDDFFLIS
jgi:hypothetical protein